MNFFKNIHLVLFVLSFLAGLLTLALSVGQYFGIYIVALLPAIVLHLVAGVRAWKSYPRFNWPILISGICFPGFSLFRLDIDTHGLFNGWGAVMARIGAAATEHQDPWEFSLEISLALLLAMIFIDTYIVRFKKNSPASSTSL